MFFLSTQLTGFLLLITQLLYMVQNKNFALAYPFHNDKHEINQRDVWRYLRKKTQSWNAELNDWVGEFGNLVGSPDAAIFEDSDERGWVDPLASWEVVEDQQTEKADQKPNTLCNNSGTAVKAQVTRSPITTSTTTTQQQVLLVPQQAAGNITTPTIVTTVTSDYEGSSNSEYQSSTQSSTIS